MSGEQRPVIVLVDDDPLLRELVKRILARQEHPVLDTGDSGRALHWCETEPVGLLISDVGLLTMSGPELAREVRRRHPGLPVLLISGLPEGDLRLERDENTSFLQKPFDADALLDLVRDALSPAP